MGDKWHCYDTGFVCFWNMIDADSNTNTDELLCLQEVEPSPPFQSKLQWSAIVEKLQSHVMMTERRQKMNKQLWIHRPFREKQLRTVFTLSCCFTVKHVSTSIIIINWFYQSKNICATWLLFSSVVQSCRSSALAVYAREMINAGALLPIHLG